MATDGQSRDKKKFFNFNQGVIQFAVDNQRDAADQTALAPPDVQRALDSLPTFLRIIGMLWKSRDVLFTVEVPADERWQYYPVLGQPNKYEEGIKLAGEALRQYLCPRATLAPEDTTRLMAAAHRHVAQKRAAQAAESAETAEPQTKKIASQSGPH